MPHASATASHQFGSCQHDDVAGPTPVVAAAPPRPARGRARRSATGEAHVAVDDRRRASSRVGARRAGRAASRRSRRRPRASVRTDSGTGSARRRRVTAAWSRRAVHRLRARAPSRAARARPAPTSAGSQRAPLSRLGPCCQPSATEIMPPSTSNTRPVTSGRLRRCRARRRAARCSRGRWRRSRGRRAHAVGEDLFGHARARRGCDRVRGHAVAADLGRLDERERGDAGLRGGVRALADAAQEARARRRVDDAAAMSTAARRPWRARASARTRGGSARSGP